MPRRLPSPVFAAVLAAVLGGRGPAHAEGFREAAEAARRSLIEALEELGAWCRKKRLFGKQDETDALILQIAPDDPRARHALEYERAPDGTWSRSPRWKPGTNWSREEIPRYEERRAEILARHAAALVASAAGAGPEELPAVAAALGDALELHPAGPGLLRALRLALLAHERALAAAGPFEARCAARRALLERFPDDPDVREALGDVRIDGTWVSRDVAATRAREPALVEAATAAVSAASDVIAESPRRPEEEESGVPWDGGFEGRHVRVVGAADPASLRRLAVHAEAAVAFFARAIGRPAACPERLAIYVFESRDHGERFVHRVPGLSAEWLAHVLAADLKGYSIGRSRYVIQGVPEADTQLDMGVLTAFDTLLQATFGRGEEMRGWVYRGLSRYLTWRLAGLRLSVTAGGRYARTAGGAAPGADDPLPLAHELHEKGEAPELRLLLGKRLEGFDPADSTLAYAFAAYLVEARAGEAAGLLERLLGEAPLDEAIAEALGEPLAETEFRLRRWLADRAEGR